MRRFLINTLILVLICFYHVRASEITRDLGSHITYDYISSNQYQVSLVYYKECAGYQFPASINICVFSDSGGYYFSSQLMPNGTPVEVTYNPGPPVVSSCQGGSGFGVLRHMYTGIVTLPAACHDWVLSYTSEMMSNGLSVPWISNYHIRAHLNNRDFPVNSSPVMNGNPKFVYCVIQTNYEVYTSSDADGDSLVYEIVTTLADSTFCVPVPHLPLLNAALGLPVSSIGWMIDSSAGWTVFYPSLIQLGFVTIRISEFRSGFLIGSTMVGHRIYIVSNCVTNSVSDDSIEEFNVYPNPASEYINIDSSSPVRLIKAYDKLGNVINVRGYKSSGSYLVETHDWPAGMYILEIEFAHTGVSRKKVVVF